MCVCVCAWGGGGNIHLRKPHIGQPIGQCLGFVDSPEIYPQQLYVARGGHASEELIPFFLCGWVASNTDL